MKYNVEEYLKTVEASELKDIFNETRGDLSRYPEVNIFFNWLKSIAEEQVYDKVLDFVANFISELRGGINFYRDHNMHLELAGVMEELDLVERIYSGLYSERNDVAAVEESCERSEDDDAEDVA